MNKIALKILLLMIMLPQLLRADESPAALLNRGKHLLNKDRKTAVQLLNRAVFEYKRLLEKNPKDFKSTLSIGTAYFYLGEDALAVEYLNKSIAIDPAKGEPHFLKGLISMYANDFGNAVKQMKIACALDPAKSSYRYHYGYALSKNGQIPPAIEAYRKAIELNDRDKRPYYNLGVIFSGQKKPDQAIAMFEKALAIDSDFVDAAYNAGQLYQNKGNHIKALESFARVFHLDGNDWRALAKIIQELHALNKNSEAEKKIELLYNLRKKKKNSELSGTEYYTREQLTLRKGKILVQEHFELKGKRPIRYRFVVYDPDTNKKLYAITLGSYETTTLIARETGEIGPKDRMFHLDGYFDNAHTTYAFFKNEPDYFLVRKMVLEILAGKREDISSTKKTKEGLEIKIKE